MEAARTSETSDDNYFTRQYIPEDNSELKKVARKPAHTCSIHKILNVAAIKYNQRHPIRK
jgi:hypothetical protein